MCYLDISNTIFNISINNLQPVTRRGVNSADKSSLRNYCTELHAKCTEYKLLKKYKKIQELTIPNHTLAESINKQLGELMNHTDKQYIQKYKNPYNVKLKIPALNSIYTVSISVI